jgi:hypothetical protein
MSDTIAARSPDTTPTQVKRVMEHRKRAVSIRMSSADVSKVKRLAQRLGVRDSDVIRYAVKSALAKLAPLHDPGVRGRSLVPVFVESGAELFHHFDLDAMRLENIINDEADDSRRVDHEDIQLIAMSGVQQPYARWHLGKAAPATVSGMSLHLNGNVVPDERTSSGGDATPSLREYLYEKYVYRNRGEI